MYKKLYCVGLFAGRGHLRHRGTGRRSAVAATRLGLARLMQGFFEQATRLEMRLAPSGHVDHLAGAWIAGGRLGPGVFDLKNPEAADLNAIAFDETSAHGGKETVNQLRGKIFFAAGVVTKEESQFFFGDRRQMLFRRGRGGTKELRELRRFALLCLTYWEL